MLGYSVWFILANMTSLLVEESRMFLSLGEWAHRCFGKQWARIGWFAKQQAKQLPKTLIWEVNFYSQGCNTLCRIIFPNEGHARENWPLANYCSSYSLCWSDVRFEFVEVLPLQLPWRGSPVCAFLGSDREIVFWSVTSHRSCSQREQCNGDVPYVAST